MEFSQTTHAHDLAWDLSPPFLNSSKFSKYLCINYDATKQRISLVTSALQRAFLSLIILDTLPESTHKTWCYFHWSYPLLSNSECKMCSTAVQSPPTHHAGRPGPHLHFSNMINGTDERMPRELLKWNWKNITTVKLLLPTCCMLPRLHEIDSLDQIKVTHLTEVMLSSGPAYLKIWIHCAIYCSWHNWHNCH